MRFEEAVLATPSISAAYREGLKALREADNNHIKCNHPRDITGSIALDTHLKKIRPHGDKNRWDYGVGVVKEALDEDEVVWIEVHSTSSGHVSEVLKKFDWLKQWLKDEAPKLNRMERRFILIASGKVTWQPGSKQRKLIDRKGIKFVGERFVLC